jgi:hypothetical protein
MRRQGVVWSACLILYARERFCNAPLYSWASVEVVRILIANKELKKINGLHGAVLEAYPKISPH